MTIIVQNIYKRLPVETRAFKSEFAGVVIFCGFGLLLSIVVAAYFRQLGLPGPTF